MKGVSRYVIKNIRKEKTESEYKKHIARVACSFLSLAILGLFIVRSNSLSDYTLGLVVGVTIGSYALSIYYFAALRHSKRLHQMYIAAYDERNKQILQATAVATLILEFFAYLCFDCPICLCQYSVAICYSLISLALWLSIGICSYSSHPI